MPLYLLHPLITAIFGFILIAIVPGPEIRRLSVYGIIFGGMIDVLAHAFGYITGLFAWINYGPFGFIGVHLFANIAWTIFFILYFYFMPKTKPLNYLFASAGIFFSIIYYNLVTDLGIFQASERIFLPLSGFTAWFLLATWGFSRLNKFIEKKEKKLH